MSSSKEQLNSVQEQFAQAQKWQSQGNLEAAVAEYRNILDVDPTSVAAWHQIAGIAEGQGKFSEAIESYRKAISLDPNPPFWIYRHLGFALSQQEQLVEAVVAYQKAIALNPEDVSTYGLLGQVHGRKGDIEGAISCYQKQIELSSNLPVWVYLNLGEGLSRCDRLEEAIEVYEKALELEPENAGIQRLLAAVTARKEASAIDPVAVAKRLQGEGKLEEALFEYRSVLEKDGSNLVALHQVAQICEGLGKWEEAVEGYRRAIEVDAESPFWVYRHLGFGLSQLGDVEGAVAAYEKAVELNPEDGAAQSLLGQVLEKRGDLDGAVESDQRAINQDTDSPIVVAERITFKLDSHVELMNESLEVVEGKITQLLQDKSTGVWLEDILAAAKLFQSQGESRIASNLFFYSLLIETSRQNWKTVCEEIPKLSRPEKLDGFISANQSYLCSKINNSIIGLIELCVGNVIKGWAFRWNDIKESVKIALFINNQKIEELNCNKFHKNLKYLGLKTGNYGFEFTVPDRYLNHKEHTISLKTVEDGLIISEAKFKFKIRGNIDLIDIKQISGWVVDENTPTKSLSLDIYINGLKNRSIVANLRREDVGEVLGFSDLGFCIDLGLEELRGQEIVLTLKDSYLPILDTPQILTTQEAKINTIALLNQKVAEFNFLTDGEKQWLTKIVFPNLKMLTRHQLDKEQEFLSAKQYNQLAWWKCRAQYPINIIVPVYRNLKVTQECLNRVLKCKRILPYQVTVINDCSPEPEIHAYLDELAQTGEINLIEHQVNQGFPKSVNHGMMFDSESDVVLLNSDAYVTDYWLDHLREAVYRDPKIATGTAFSNNATIFSYPVNCQETENVPDDVTLEELAKIFYQVNKENIVQVPTGHGFCLYIRRDALREVGYFDAETWGKGYGEEVDWCQKALDLGWRHVAATGVFVQHVGSQSFVGDKTDLLNNSLSLMREKYPEYDIVIQKFLQLDPFAEIRRNVDMARLKRSRDRFILMVNHCLGGGTEKHFQDLANFLELENISILMLKPDSRSQDWVELTSPKFKLDLLARYNLPRDFPALVKNLKDLGVFHIHIHHTLGFSDDLIEKLLQALDLSYDVTLHDYISICPRINLTQDEGKYCKEPPVEVCELCVNKNGVPESLQKRYQRIGSVKNWISQSHKILQDARKVFVPSQDMRDRMVKHLPKIEFTVKPHPERVQKVTLSSNNENESTVRVGLIGGISRVKGLQTLYDCATYAAHVAKDIEFIVIGTTADNSLFENMQNVTICGSYYPEELKDLIRKNHLDFAAFFSTWPETYCYTLSEALENGLYPFAFDLGAVGHRIRDLGVGYLVNPEVNVATLVECLYDFGYECRQNQRIIEIGNESNDFRVSKYYEYDVFFPEIW
jgi:tetratricopeptide (TPR) repeat protein/GT2 family glycosyltransferase/glycosyltransferase involved in cell wall biosynthesis